MKSHAILEEKHIFTCFENRMNVAIPDSGEGEEDFKWNAACVIRVFRDRRNPQLGKLETHSHTQRMYEEEPEYIITDPIPGEMSLKLQSFYMSTGKRGKKAIVLVGSGSAVNFILDFLLWLDSTMDQKRRIKIIYTTRDDALFEWSTSALAAVLTRLNDSISNRVELDLSQIGELDLFAGTELSKGLRTSMRNLDSSCHCTSYFNSRINLDEEKILPGAKVFCQGSSTFKNAVKKANKNVNASFERGEGGH